MNGLALFDRSELLGIKTETPKYRILKYHVWYHGERFEYYIIQELLTFTVPRQPNVARKKGAKRPLIEVDHWKDIWEGLSEEIDELKFLLTLFNLDLHKPPKA